MKRVMTKIDDLIDEISMGPFGSDIKVESFVDFGVPVLNGANVSGIKLIEDNFNYVSEDKAKSLKKANAKRGDIVITHRGTLGQVSYIPHDSVFENYVISQSQFRVRLNTKLVDPRYFTYYFHTKEGQKRLLSFKNHVGVPALAQATTNFRLLEFPLVPLEVQRRIADILSNIDSKISLNNRINAELEAMAKTIYDYWFVQFDFPISKGQAQAMGKPKLEGKPYKASGGEMVWSEELKREVPKGWEVGTLSDIANITMGQSPPGESYNDVGDGTVFFQGSTDFGLRFPTTRKFTTLPGRMAMQGDILLSVRAPVGAMNIAKVDCCIGRGLAALNSKDDCIAYLHGVMRNLHQVFERRNKDGTTFGAITKDDLFSLGVIRPLNEVLRVFDSITKPIFFKQNIVAEENQKLIELRDWLLPMLMNGQVKIKETAKSIVAKPVVPQSKPANPYFYQTQLVAAIVNASRKNKISHGEMTLAKYTYLVDKLYGVPTYFNYERWHLGPYPKEMKKVVNNKKFFKIQNNEVSVVPQKKEYNYEFKQQVEEAIVDLASIFHQYKGKERSHQTELLATVCKVVEDIQSTDLKKVRESMKKWPIELKGEKFKDKAEKFGKEETETILLLMQKKGWDKLVMAK